MTKAEIEFQIAQLRQDKIIYAVESIAISAVGFLVYGSLDLVIYLLPQVQNYLTIIAGVSVFLPVAYLLFMAVGNTLRCLKIRKLSKMLSEKKK